MRRARVWAGAVLLALASSVAARGATDAPSDERVRQALLAAWQQGGETALREYVGQNRDAVSRQLLVSLASLGMEDRSDPARSQTLLSIAKTAAAEKGDQGATADVLVITGRYHYYISDYERARALYEQALPLYEAEGDPRGQGDVYRRRGDIYLYTGDHAQALAMYEKALPFFEKANHPVGQGNVYKGRGEIHLYSGDNAQALTMFEKALPFFEKANDAIGQGNVYRSRGDIYLNTGDNAQALTMYEKALPFFEKANDLLGQGTAYRSRGDIYRYTGDNAQALAMYEKALPFFEKANHSVGQGNVYRNRGEIYLYTGDNVLALVMFEKALTFFEKGNEPLGQGAVYGLRGDSYLNTGDYAQALAMYEKALPYFEKANHPVGQGAVYLGRGGIYFQTGDNAQALAMYEKALAYFEKANEPLGQGDVYKSRGDLYLRTGDTAQALAMYDKALGYYALCESREGQADAWYGQAGAYAQGARRDLALASYERSLDLLEQIRQRTGVEELKLGFMEKVLDKYDGAAGFMLRNGFGEAAFRTTERMKARLFLDRLAEGLVDLEKGIPPEMKAQRDGLEARLAALRNQRMELYSWELGEVERERRLREVSAAVEKADRELADLKGRIRIGNPLYASVQYPQSPTAAEVRSQVLRADEALIEYFLSQEDAWVFVLTQDAFEVVKLPATTAEIEAKVDTLIDRASRPVVGRATGTDAPAAALYDALVAPLASRIIGKRLIVVPDGALARLPFEMLQAKQDGKAKLPVDLHPLRYAQSASVLAFYRTQYRREGTSERFAGFGDPVYDNDAFTKSQPERGVSVAGDALAAGRARRGLERAGVSLDRLPGTGAEVRAIGDLFRRGQREGATFLRAQATEERAKSEDLAGYGYLHFATHGILDDDYQAVALSQVPGGEDGMLTLGEIMNLHWDARLVVLSACETGLGKVRRGEGVTGLTRAVMYAGSPAAVVSLWKVSDEGTKQLMTRFYQGMIDGALPPADALRQAKLEMAKDPTWRAPYNWAGFVLYGE